MSFDELRHNLKICRMMIKIMIIFSNRSHMIFSLYKEVEFKEYISKLNMGVTLSARWIRFNSYRFQDRNLITPISEIFLLKEAF